jgi:two-component system copper resistance phosphate regulon response regulator CusR
VKILIVEDEPKTGEYLRQGLSEAGYVADLVPHGTDGLHMALHGAYDLVILDVMLPGLNGWQVLQSLRERGLQMPVLFLTARDQVEDRVKGWSLAPTTIWSSRSRLRNCWPACASSCGGPAGNEGTMLRVADLELDLLRRRVSRNGKRVDLTAKEFGLLELLMRRHGEVLPRSLIASQVWDMNFDSDTNVIEVAMRRLRMKIDEGHPVKLIQTVRGMGYVLDVPQEE